MSQLIQLEAQARDTLGKGASRRLRHQSLVPAIIYGGGEAPESITLVYKDFIKHLENEAFFSSILTIMVDGKEELAVIKALQRHPAKGFPMHADFMRIVKGQEITMRVPLHFVGQDVCPGIKTGGVLDTIAVDVEISTLPKNLPEYLEADVSALEKGDSLHLSDITLPEGVSLVELSHGDDHDQAIAIVQVPRGPKEEETPAADAAEGGDEAAEGGDAAE